MAQRGTEEPLDKGERGEYKSRLKLSIQKMKTIASSPITSWQIEEEKVARVADFISLGSKITRTVTATMQSKDTCSLEGKP